MRNLLVGIRNRITTIGWAFSLAWKFNKLLLVFSFIMLTLASILPAIAISYNKEIIRSINIFIQDNVGSFDDILATIIFYGLFTTLVGVSNRLNEDFIYSIMFDSYYFGMEEILMDSVQSYSMKELLNKTTNDEFNSCVMREGALTDFISGFCILWGRIVTFISLIIVSFSFSVSVSIISSIYIILVIQYNLFVSNRIRSFWNEIRASERLANYYENLFMVSECAKEMRVFGSSEYIRNKWNETYLPIFEYEKKEKFNGELRIFISSIGYYIFLAIVLVLSVWGISNKTLTVDTVLVVFSLGLNIFTTVKNVAKTIVVTERGLFSLESQYKFFDKYTQHKIEDSAVVLNNNQKTVFEGKNLSFSYNEKDIVLDNVDFSIKKGETVALIGLNGSGKSTLIKLLLGLYKPTSGSLYFEGNNYNELTEGFLRNRVSTFFQDFYLFHMSIHENVGFGDVVCIDAKSRIIEALTKGGAVKLIEGLPLEINTYVHKWIETTGVELSGGESQKIAVSRAYMSNSDIVIFDEPASMMDPISELEQFVNIKNSMNNKTAILVSHRVGFAQLADRIILMDKGKIVETGTHDDLLVQNGEYARLFKEQAQWYQEEAYE